jgi:hypothetical protein
MIKKYEDACEQTLNKTNNLNFILFYLRIVKNYTFKDIEERMGISQHATWHRLESVYKKIYKNTADENISK